MILRSKYEKFLKPIWFLRAFLVCFNQASTGSGRIFGIFLLELEASNFATFLVGKFQQLKIGFDLGSHFQNNQK